MWWSNVCIGRPCYYNRSIIWTIERRELVVLGDNLHGKISLFPETKNWQKTKTSVRRGNDSSLSPAPPLPDTVCSGWLTIRRKGGGFAVQGQERLKCCCYCLKTEILLPKGGSCRFLHYDLSRLRLRRISGCAVTPLTSCE